MYVINVSQNRSWRVQADDRDMEERENMILIICTVMCNIMLLYYNTYTSVFA